MEERDTYFGSDARYRLFKATKYIVYLLLSFNVYLFLREELLALSFTYGGDIEPGQFIQAFSATIDTAAWVILLLMFELETAVLDDRSIHGLVKWCLHGLRGVCTIALLYAFTGYYQELLAMYQVAPLSIGDACSLVGADYSRLITLDEYEALNTVNCAAMGDQLYTLGGFNILADAETLRAVQILAWVDVINAAAWILVVVVLEVEVRLQLRGNLSGPVMNFNRAIKTVLYAMLFLCAAYWGYGGDFLDVWDACLWLFAFIFIELNVFEWHYEAEHEQPSTA